MFIALALLACTPDDPTDDTSAVADDTGTDQPADWTSHWAGTWSYAETCPPNPVADETVEVTVSDADNGVFVGGMFYGDLSVGGTLDSATELTLTSGGGPWGNFVSGSATFDLDADTFAMTYTWNDSGTEFTCTGTATK